MPLFPPFGAVDVRFVIFTLCVFFCGVSAVDISQFSPVDGYGNNKNNPNWGSAKAGVFSRFLPAFRYSGSSSNLSQILNNPVLPNALNLSALSFLKLASNRSSSKLNVFAMHFAEALLHDIMLEERSSSPVLIPVTKCDPVFDSFCFGNATFPYYPLVENATDSSQSPIYRNLVTSFVDASFIYGSTFERMNARRSGSGGLLLMGLNNYLPIVNSLTSLQKPFNSMNSGSVFSSGDSRVNSNSAIQIFHTLLAREHNRRAGQLLLRNPSWDDSTIFYNARKWVIGIWQKFVFYDFLPLILGFELSPYNGYDKNEDPSISIALLSGGLNFYASTIPSYFNILDQSGLPLGPGVVPHRDTINSITQVQSFGIEPFLRGLVSTIHGVVSPKVNSAFRYASYDLSARRDFIANLLLTDRDSGMPPFITTCNYLVIDQLAAFTSLTSIYGLTPLLTSIYNGDSKLLDSSYGSLVHTPYEGILFSEMTLSFLTRTFISLRNGDRFFFHSNMSYYSADDVYEIGNFTLNQLISLNTEISNFPENPLLLSNILSSSPDFEDNVDYSTFFQAPSSIQASSAFQIKWFLSTSSAMQPYVIFEFDIQIPQASTTAWFGLGFGNGINNTDMMILSFSKNFYSLYDCWAENYVPSLDTSYFFDGKNDLFDFKVLSPPNDFIHRRIQFSRLLNTSDKYDIPIILETPIQIVWAYSLFEEFPSYHKLVRDTTTVVFSKNHTVSLVSATTLSNLAQISNNLSSSIVTGFGSCFPYVHGIFMLILFMGFIPIAVFMSRYMTENPYWLEIHEKLTTCFLSQFLASTVTTFTLSNLSTNSIHPKLGVILIFFVFFTAIMGYLMRYASEFLEKHPRISSHTRTLHGIFGYIVFGIGQYECLVGLLDLFGENFDYSQLLIWYGLWVLSLMCAITIGEYRVYLKSVLPYNPTAKQNYKLAMKKKYEHLPEFTWKDISERVLKGSLWIEIDYVLYNVAQYAHLHPGGPHLLFQAVGTDASSLFDASVKDLELIQQLKDCEKSDKVSLGSGRSSFSIAIGDDEQGDAEKILVDAKYRLVSNLHSHSRLAMLKMELLAVGTLDKSDLNCEFDHISDRIQKDMFPRIMNPGIWPYKAKILAISSKKQVSGPDAQTIVINLKLKFESENQTAHFFPGDHIVLQHVSKTGKTVTRSYTPIRQYAVGELSLLIKLYHDGEFCKLLAKMSEGDSIIARGPIPGKNVLTNVHDNTACYQAVGMIVAGTGLTPALLLIDHYLRYGPRDTNDNLTVVLSLLFANASEDDIFFRKELEDLVIDSRGSLKIHFCVMEASEGWLAYSGLVNDDMIRETMPAPNFRSLVNQKGEVDFRTQSGNMSSQNSAAGSKASSTGKSKFGASGLSLASQNSSDRSHSQIGLREDAKASSSRVGLSIQSSTTASQRFGAGSSNRIDGSQASVFTGQAKPGTSIISSSSLLAKKNNTKTLFGEEETLVKIMVCGSTTFNSTISEALVRIGYKKNQIEVLE